MSDEGAAVSDEGAAMSYEGAAVSYQTRSACILLFLCGWIPVRHRKSFPTARTNC